ncbi:uncharacterized protein EI90DRAFT_2321650 [Cantharellus anzutake]|uniref:uncharacterized protein n=1 Tax=Cantharellus anzutake TaxID=1750568 RepID=UPI001908DDB5|nr:uncharacterized protein EI90DRAFT_2321650 [Cantharellus anzutake]KAF8324541.1 hypothetical protein EI90DRAFT_2321650 [Cantharellus anzutake]
MDLLVRLTSLNMKSRPVPPGLVVPLRFWRELVHLYENDGFFDEMHYPCLSETWLTVKSGNLDVGFIVNDAKPLPGDQGTHWTACVLSVSTGEYRFGDSLDAQPPLLLQPALELWLARCNALPPGAQLRRGNDLDHASQTDGWSCGIIAVNTLEHHFLDYPLWGPNKNADIRITKYINLLEYNRGAPLPPPRSRASSVSTDASQRSRSRTRTLSTRPDVYFGDIPVEGQDLAVLRGWTPEEGAGISSKYQENVPILNNQAPSEIPGRQTRNGPDQPLPMQDPNNSPQLSSRSPAIQHSRPIGVPSAPAHIRPTRDRGRVPADIPAGQGEWERESPQEDRGRRPRPIMPPPPSGKIEDPRLWPEDQLNNTPVCTATPVSSIIIWRCVDLIGYFHSVFISAPPL